MEQIIQRELWCKQYSIDPSILLLAERNYLRYKRMFLALLEYCHEHNNRSANTEENQPIAPLLPSPTTEDLSLPKPLVIQGPGPYDHLPPNGNKNSGVQIVTRQHHLSPNSPEKMAVIGSSLLSQVRLGSSGMIVNDELAKSIDNIYWVKNEIQGDLVERETKVRTRHTLYSKKLIEQHLAKARLDDKWKVPKTIEDYLKEDEIDRFKKLIFLGFFLNVGKLVRKPSETETRGNEEDEVIEYLLVNENKLYQLHLKSSFYQTKANPPEYIIAFKKLHLRATKDYIFNICDIEFAWIKERYESLLPIKNLCFNSSIGKFIQLEERRLAGEIVMNRQDIIFPVPDSLIRQFLKGNGKRRIQLQNQLNANIDFIDNHLKKIKVSPLSDDCFFISALTTSSQFTDLMSSQQRNNLQEKLEAKIEHFREKRKNRVEEIFSNYNRFLVGRGGRIIKKLHDKEFTNVLLDFPIDYPLKEIRNHIKDIVKFLDCQKTTTDDLNDSVEITASRNDLEEIQTIFVKFNSEVVAADFFNQVNLSSFPGIPHKIIPVSFQPLLNNQKLPRITSTSVTVKQESKTLKVYWSLPSDGKCSLYFYKPLNDQQLTECKDYIKTAVKAKTERNIYSKTRDCIVIEKLSKPGERFSDVDMRIKLYENHKVPPVPIKSIIMSNSLLDPNSDFSAIMDDLKQKFTDSNPQIILSKSPSAKLVFTSQDQAINAFNKIKSVQSSLHLSNNVFSLRAEFYLKVSICFPHKLFYVVLKNRVDAYLNQLHYEYPQYFFQLSTTNDYSLVIKPREFLSSRELFEKWAGDVLIVKSRVVSKLLNCKKLPDVFYKYFSTKNAFLNQIGNESGCFVFIDKEKSNIIVYGEDMAIQKVFWAVERKVKDEQLYMGSFPLNPSAASAFFALWRKELRSTCAKNFPNTKIELDYTSKQIFAYGSKLEVENLSAFITETIRNLPPATPPTPYSDDNAECMLCFCDTSTDEKGLTLLCNHWIHQDCLKQMVINSPENLACLNCNELICLDDLMDNGFFSPSDIENMKGKWVDVFVKNNKDRFQFCPMENGCNALCETSRYPCHAECPNSKCHGSFCGKCFKAYHGNTDCDKDKAKDYSDIMKSNPSFKQCPHCKIPQERFIGCNAVQCPYCSGYWCYRCGKGFAEDAHKHFKDPTVDCYRKLFD